MHTPHAPSNSNSPAPLPPALAARLSLYGERRKAYIALAPFSESIRARMFRAVDTEVSEAADVLRGQPEPVARLRAELLFWTGFYRQDVEPQAFQGEQEDREEDGESTKDLQARWAAQSLLAFKQVFDLLEGGNHPEAFRVLADMPNRPELYGPVPDPLDLTGARWLDLSAEVLPPGHLFLDEQAQAAAVEVVWGLVYTVRGTPVNPKC